MSLSDRLNSADGTMPGDSDPELPVRPRPPTGEGNGAGPGRDAPPVSRRRTSDRSTSNDLWLQSKAKVQAKVLTEIAPRAADLSPDELRGPSPKHRERDPRARGHRDFAH